MNALQQELGITGKQKIFTQTIQKPKKFNKVKENTLLKDNYNFMADLLFLPKTKQGYIYLFVIVDLASDEFDIEPLKDKNSSEIVKAIYAINKRKYIQIKVKYKKSKPEKNIDTFFSRILIRFTCTETYICEKQKTLTLYNYIPVGQQSYSADHR